MVIGEKEFHSWEVGERAGKDQTEGVLIAAGGRDIHRQRVKQAVKKCNGKMAESEGLSMWIFRSHWAICVGVLFEKKSAMYSSQENDIGQQQGEYSWIKRTLRLKSRGVGRFRDWNEQLWDRKCLTRPLHPTRWEWETGYQIRGHRQEGSQLFVRASRWRDQEKKRSWRTTMVAVPEGAGGKLVADGNVMWRAGA